MGFWKVFCIAIVVIVAAVGLLLYQYFCGSWSTLQVAERNGIAQIYLGTVSVIAIVFTLLYSTFQFRKALAKPQLRIVVGQNMGTKTSISTTKSARGALTDEASLNLYVYNDGNLVADLYSIEFTIPSIFKPEFITADTDHYGVQTLTGIPDGQLSTITFYSHRADEYISYVHKLVNIGKMIINITQDTKDKVPKRFKISYQIFGSWADKQQGSLDISLNVN